MKNQELRIQELTSLGLSLNEAKTYLALLIKNDMTINEIAQVSGVPRAKVYGVIKKLITRGFCVEKAGDIKKCKAVDPQIVVKKLNEVYQQTIEKRQMIAKKFADSVALLYEQNIDKTDSLDYIQVLQEKNRIAEKFKNFEDNAQSEILVFSKAPYTDELDDTMTEGRISIIKEKVIAKSIYEISDVKQDDFLKMIEKYAETGEGVRIAQNLPLKLAIFDERIVMYALRDRVTMEPTLTSVVVEHPDFAILFKRIFYSYWQEAMTLEEYKLQINKNTGR